MKTENYANNVYGHTPFNTAIEGVEIIALVDYHPETEDERGKVAHWAQVQYVIHAGADIMALVSKQTIQIIEQRFLEAMDEAAKQAKTERQIDAWESRQ